MLGYFSADIICSENWTVFRERSSRKTVSFEEQIMSKDKYLSIFSQPNWGYCVYYPSVLKIGEYPRIFPSFSWGIFPHMTRLDQSRANENIWWIVKNNIEAWWHDIEWTYWWNNVIMIIIVWQWIKRQLKKCKISVLESLLWILLSLCNAGWIL